MLKRFFLLSIILMSATYAMAQFNVQLHYDFGRTIYPSREPIRQLVTLTGELYLPDVTGYTTGYIDADYHDKTDGKRKIVGTYWEIGHDFIVLDDESDQNDFSAHIEYDGGIYYTDRFQHSVLIGPAWQWRNRTHTRRFIFQALYKQYFGNGAQRPLPGFQLSALWDVNMSDGLITLDGFFDVWRGRINSFDPNHVGMIFHSEPQLWFNILGRHRKHNRLSLGTEWEISNDLIWSAVGNRTFFFNPTLAAKYTF